MPGAVGSSGNPAARRHAGLPPRNTGGGGGGAASSAGCVRFGFVRLTKRRAGVAGGAEGFAARTTGGFGEGLTKTRRGAPWRGGCTCGLCRERTSGIRSGCPPSATRAVRNRETMSARNHASSAIPRAQTGSTDPAFQSLAPHRGRAPSIAAELPSRPLRRGSASVRCRASRCCLSTGRS